MIEKYKLFENLQKAKKIISDLNISEDNEKFQKLKDLLKSNLGYMGTFTKWLFIDREPWEKVEDLYKELKNVNLDRPVDSFEKLEDLYDYIADFKINKKTNQVIKSLPSRTRKLVDDKLKELIRLNTDYAESIKDFYSKKGGRYKDIESLYSDTKDLINNLKGDFNLESMKEKIKDLDVEIIHESPEVLMVKVNDYDASCKIGSKHWCISTSESYFKSYVNEFTNQYFIYDFTKDISDKRHMIGATISPSGEISSAHWADDSPVNDYSIFDEL